METLFPQADGCTIVGKMTCSMAQYVTTIPRAVGKEEQWVRKLTNLLSILSSNARQINPNFTGQEMEAKEGYMTCPGESIREAKYSSLRARSYMGKSTHFLGRPRKILRPLEPPSSHLKK